MSDAAEGQVEKRKAKVESFKRLNGWTCCSSRLSTCFTVLSRRHQEHFRIKRFRESPRCASHQGDSLPFNSTMIARYE